MLSLPPHISSLESCAGKKCILKYHMTLRKYSKHLSMLCAVFLKFDHLESGLRAVMLFYSEVVNT